MLGTEQRHQLRTFRLAQHIGRAPARRVERRAVGDQPDPPAGELAEAIGFEHVDPRHHAGLRAARRGANDGRDAIHHLQVVALAGGMQAVGQRDHEALGRGIDPDRGAGIAGMAIGLRREGRRHPDRIGRVDVPAQTPQGRAAGRALRRRHGRNRLRRQHALAAAQHHLRELREIVGRGEGTGVARDAAHLVGDGILHLAPTQFAILDIGRRDAVALRRWWPEAGVAHAQRLEDVLGGIGLERLAGHQPHDVAQHDEVDVAVDEARAGRRQRLHRGNGVERALGARPATRRDAGRQGGIVRHELAHGDAALAVGGEGRPVGRRRLVERDLAALDQLQDRHRRRHHLGEGGRVIDRVEGGRLYRRHDRAIAIGLAQDDAVVDSHHDDGAGNFSGRDLLAHDVGDGIGRLAGRRRRRWSGRGRRGRRRAGNGELADQGNGEETQDLNASPRQAWYPQAWPPHAWWWSAGQRQAGHWQAPA